MNKTVNSAKVNKGTERSQGLNLTCIYLADFTFRPELFLSSLLFGSKYYSCRAYGTLSLFVNVNQLDFNLCIEKALQVLNISQSNLLGRNKYLIIVS